MNLPEGFSVFGKRNARELSVLRAENALMRRSVLPDLLPDCLSPTQPRSVTAAVDSVVNGTFVSLDEVFHMVDSAHPHLNASRESVRASLKNLVSRSKLIRVGSKRCGQFSRMVAVLCLCLLASCSTPQFSNVTTAPSPKINWYADVEWPVSESPGVKTYHVEYGLHVNTMTNELVTATNRCRVYGLELGRTYYFSVRASDGKQYSLRTDIATFKTP